MKLGDSVRPISYLKAHASEVIRDVTENRRTVVITQHGRARVVLQDVRAYDELMESLAFLKLLGRSRQSLREGRGVPLEEAERRIRQRTEPDDA